MIICKIYRNKYRTAIILFANYKDLAADIVDGYAICSQR